MDNLHEQSAPRTQRSARTSLIVLGVCLLAAALTALSGNGATLPLDEHEVFVARTAEEMLARGSVIVPYFNDEPRLRKPPLCYWLVMAVDCCNGGDGIVSEWEARIPSIAAGMALVGLTFGLGLVMLGERRAALIASLLVCGSSGYVYYTHSARPEMVYAALCTAGVFGIALSDRSLRDGWPRRAAWAARLGWLCFGLAVLTKGVQLPALLLPGYALGMAMTGRSAQIMRVIRPRSGLLIMLAVSLWWYVAVWQLVPQTQEALHLEATGRIFNFAEGRGWRYFDPYYVYRTAGLVLPWVLLYVPAVALPLVKEMRGDTRARLLWWVLIVPLVGLHISLGRRWYYMLPAMAPLALLMAKCGLTIGQAWLSRGRIWLVRGLLVVHIVGLAAVLVGYRLLEPQPTAPPLLMLILAMTVLTSILVIVIRLRPPHARSTGLAAAGFAGVVFFCAAAYRGSVWEHKRLVRHSFSLAVARTVSADAALLGWQFPWEPEQYCGHRTVRVIQRAAELRHALRSNTVCYLLVRMGSKPDLPKDLHHTAVLKLDSEEHEALELWRINSTGAQ